MMYNLDFLQANATKREANPKLEQNETIQIMGMNNKTIALAVLLAAVDMIVVPAYAQESDPDNCGGDGYNDGQNGPFSQDRYDNCGDEGGADAYYQGFIDGCMSVEGNTQKVCEQATDAD